MAQAVGSFYVFEGLSIFIYSEIFRDLDSEIFTYSEIFIFRRYSEIFRRYSVMFIYSEISIFSRYIQKSIFSQPPPNNPDVHHRVEHTIEKYILEDVPMSLGVAEVPEYFPASGHSQKKKSQRSQHLFHGVVCVG